MRKDLADRRAASGSLLRPNSTMSTIATIGSFHGLSEKVTNHFRRPLSLVLVLLTIAARRLAEPCKALASPQSANRDRPKRGAGSAATNRLAAGACGSAFGQGAVV